MLLARALTSIISLAITTATVMAQPASDTQKGKQLFNECRACHSLDAGKNGIGPSLHGVFGRKAGTEPGYSYSTAMKNANVLWSEDALKKYLADPHKFIPGDKMGTEELRFITLLQSVELEIELALETIDSNRVKSRKAAFVEQPIQCLRLPR